MDRRTFLQTTTVAGLLSSSLLKGLPFADAESAPGDPQVDGSANLYVATSGSDRNPGSKERPVATLARAKDAVRELKKRIQRPIKVWVGRGTYYLGESLVFESEDSGTTEQPITYAAHPGELVTLSGAQKLTCKWKPYKDGIMMCSLPAMKQVKASITQLFINGKRQIRARYPNYDAKNPLPIGDGYTDMATIAAGKKPLPTFPQDWPATKWPLTEFRYDPEKFTKKRWAKPHEAVVNTFNVNCEDSLHWQVKDVDWDAHLVKLGRGGFHQNDLLFKMATWAEGPLSRFFVENVFEELDAPGEWYLDRENGVLYCMPAEEVDINTALVEVSILKRLIEFRGSQEDPIRHLTLSGFRIAHTERTILDDYEALSGGDWTIHRGGAVFLEGTEDCNIERCFFDGVGGNAIFVNNYNRRIAIYGNKFTEGGDSAICLVGTKNRCIGSSQAFPADNRISNNLIHRVRDFCPRLKLVVNHLAKPSIAAREFDFWAGEIESVSQLPYIWCKLSGMITEANHESWTTADLQPYVNHIIKTFGRSHVMFGSDWPVCTLAGSYQQVVDTLRQSVGPLSETEAAMLWGDTASEVYRLDFSK